AQIFNLGRGVRDLEAVAFALGRECLVGWIRRSIRRYDLQIVGAVRHGRRVPRIVSLREFVLQQAPVLLPLASIVNRIDEVVVVVIMSAPEHALLALFFKSLRRNLYFRSGRGIWVNGRRR